MAQAAVDLRRYSSSNGDEIDEGEVKIVEENVAGASVTPDLNEVKDLRECGDETDSNASWSR